MTTTSNKFAAPEHFASWKENARAMSDAALAYAVSDAGAAAKACAGWDPCGENFYRDQAMTYQQEIAERAEVRRKPFGALAVSRCPRLLP
jgi:hypothetical protein